MKSCWNCFEQAKFQDTIMSGCQSEIFICQSLSFHNSFSLSICNNILNNIRFWREMSWSTTFSNFASQSVEKVHKLIFTNKNQRQVMNCLHLSINSSRFASNSSKLMSSSKSTIVCSASIESMRTLMVSLVNGGEPLSLARTRSTYFWPEKKKK